MGSTDLGGVLDNLQDTVFLLDADRSVVYANERLRTVTGSPGDDLVGRDVTTLDEFVDEESVDEFTAAVDAVLAGEEDERRLELDVSSPHSRAEVVEARITTHPKDGGEAAAVVVLRDVTERKRREAALSKRSEQLTIINRVLRHDIRNDMEVTIGWTEYLDRFVEDEEAQAALDRVLDQGRHVVELTKEARDLVEAVESDWEMNLDPVDLRPVLRREVESVRAQYPGATVTLRDEDLDATVRANEFLGSVFGNLLANAVIHNDADAPTVTVDGERTDGTVTVRVTDDGPGIPEAQRDRLFEKGTKGPESLGSGMGLYLVNSLVNAYGGSVSVEDADPRGTVVTVELPVA